VYCEKLKKLKIKIKSVSGFIPDCPGHFELQMPKLHSIRKNPGVSGQQVQKHLSLNVFF